MEITLPQFALMLHSVPHLGPKGIQRILCDISAPIGTKTINLSELQFWKLSADCLIRNYKVHPEAAHYIEFCKEQLLNSSRDLLKAVQKLGIHVVTVVDSDYPPCIREYEAHPPPILYIYGNMSLLRERKFAVISSNDISGRSIEITREISSLLSEEGLTAVTSHNTHSYQIVGIAAKSRNAPLVLVLDRGILSAFPQGLGWEPVAQARIWDLRFDPQRDVVISKFRVYDPWIGANGRERDRMVFSMADIVVAVEVRAGGVMEAECLRAFKHGREVYVYKPDDGEPPAGNQTLLNKGCEPLNPTQARSLMRTLDLPNDDDLELSQ
ncbi:MAG: DNA-processing protein DprA [Armatimonadota bacterium]|nr:DNA-processing protein DprA [Armatimonadota bacterium]